MRAARRRAEAKARPGAGMDVDAASSGADAGYVGAGSAAVNPRGAGQAGLAHPRPFMFLFRS